MQSLSSSYEISAPYNLFHAQLSDDSSSEAYSFYLYRSMNAALGFRAVLKAVEDLIVVEPFAGTIYDKSRMIYSFKLPRYPYRVYYQIIGNEIQELLVFNTYQNPHRLRELLKQF